MEFALNYSGDLRKLEDELKVFRESLKQNKGQGSEPKSIP